MNYGRDDVKLYQLTVNTLLSQ